MAGMRNVVLTSVVFVVLVGLFSFAALDFKLPWAGQDHGTDWCEEHKVELSKCEKCNPNLARGGTVVTREREPAEDECPNTLVRITLAPGVAERIGIDPKPVSRRKIKETLRANAETLYVPAKYARVVPRTGGIVREVKATLGQVVEEGAVLAVLESPEFGRAKSEVLQGLDLLALRQKTYDQVEELSKKGIAVGRDLLQAKTQLEEARLGVEQATQRLAALGLSEDQIKRVEKNRDTSALMDVAAPFASTVVEALAVKGENVGSEKALFVVADMDRLWISIDVYESDLPKIEKGQRVVFTVEGFPGKRFSGEVVAIGGEVDDRTRTLPVFAEVENENPPHVLRAKMFGRAAITIRPPEPMMVLPKEAVQYDGDCYLVFVSPIPNVLRARKVEIGTVFECGYEIVGGLAGDEKVVMTGSFLLKTEVLRGQMGAG